MHLADKQQGAHRPGLTRATLEGSLQPRLTTASCQLWNHPRDVVGSGKVAVATGIEKGGWEESYLGGAGPRLPAQNRGRGGREVGRDEDRDTRAAQLQLLELLEKQMQEGTRVHVGSPGIWYPGSSQPSVSTELQRRGKNFQSLKPLTTITTIANPCRH